MSNPFSGPIPPYNNPPIEPQFFQPSLFFIQAIALGANTLVTTTVNHNYVLKQQVRLLIPPSFGSRGLNEQTAFVIAIPAPNQVLLDISSIGVDPFILSSATTKSQIAAIGDANNGFINANGRFQLGTFIPGSFENISPN